MRELTGDWRLVVFRDGLILDEGVEHGAGKLASASHCDLLLDCVELGHGRTWLTKRMSASCGR